MEIYSQLLACKSDVNRTLSGEMLLAP